MVVYLLKDLGQLSYALGLPELSGSKAEREDDFRGTRGETEAIAHCSDSLVP